MAIDQSQIQRLLEATSGVQAKAQNAQPGNPNNGNPNTVNNNASWMIPVQSNAAGQWWAPAPLQMPTSGASTANSILSNLQNMRNANRDPNNPLGTTPLPNPTGTPPGGPGSPSTPTTPGTPYDPTGWAGPNFIGPISGPVTNNPHNFAGNFGIAQPNTNLFESGLGRQYSMDWLRNTMQATGGTGRINPNGNFSQTLQRLASRVGAALGGQFANLGEEFRELLSDATGQDGLAGIARALGTLAGIPGMEALLPRSYDESWQLSEQDLQRAEASMAANRERIQSDFMNRTGDAASQSMQSFLQQMAGRGWTREQAQQYWESMPEMSRQEWNRTQESMNWNNFWNSRGQGTTRNPVTGLPSQDLIDDMINQMQQRALNWTVQMRDRWTRHR